MNDDPSAAQDWRVGAPLAKSKPEPLVDAEIVDHGPGPSFSATREALRELLTWRRDVRRFRTEPLGDGVLERLLDIAQLAPSVGLSQPWRFVLVDSPERRALVRRNFADANAQALGGYDGARARLYAGLKLAGLDDAPAHLAVFADVDPPQGAGLGRRTMPETLVYSAVIAIHTLWLAARIEGVGLGWVSILDPVALASDLLVPTHWRLVAYLCLGRPLEESDTPELERAGWERRSPPGSRLVRR
jgi:5,6-dimethylbenzimidazole synthase